MGNHCDYINPVMGNMPVMWLNTVPQMNFFPSQASDWRTVSFDIPPGFLTNSSRDFYIRWNFDVGHINTLTPNVFIDNIRFENLAVRRIDPLVAMGATLWPNPGDARMGIRLPPTIGRAHVQVVGMLGQEMGSWAMDAETMEIETLGWPAGIYLVRVTPVGSDDHSTQTLRWVKE
jgi:hypothetical protein